MKILVVHRQATVLNQVKDILQDNQTIIRYYASGLDGLLAARAEEFEMIVCGTDLPVITGYELIRSLRNQSFNESAAVIFIADEVDGKSAHLGKALGATAVLSYDTMSTELQSMLALSR